MDRALPILQSEDRLVGVAAAGSWITGTMDEFSDIDLIAVARPEAYATVMADRFKIVESLGTVLSAFTGEHVGEPRVLICLYADPLLHVDVKFVSLDDFGRRIEDPIVLFERDGALTLAMAASEPRHPMPDIQWIEDRFWVWVHYAALRLGRGELFEVLDMLAFLRGQVLGPLALVSHGQLPRGVRRIETLARADVPAFEKTVATYDRSSCAAAIEAAVALYRVLRERAKTAGLKLRAEAEAASLTYLREIIERS